MLDAVYSRSRRYLWLQWRGQIFPFLLPLPFPMQNTESLFKQFCQAMKMVATHQNSFFLLGGPLNECYITSTFCYVTGNRTNSHANWGRWWWRDMTESSWRRELQSLGTKPQEAKTQAPDHIHQCLLTLGFLINWPPSTSKQLTLATLCEWGESRLVVDWCEQVKQLSSQTLMELLGFHLARKVVDSAGPVLGE